MVIAASTKVYTPSGTQEPPDTLIRYAPSTPASPPAITAQNSRAIATPR